MIIAPDVSYFQVRVDSSFNRQWLIFRCCDGAFVDPNASFNADWSRGAVVQGRILGWTTYVVYRPGKNASVLANLRNLGPLDRVMIDVEAWRGTSSPIVGDHSADINFLVASIVALGVPFKNVWRYGNVGDLASIHPRPLPGQLTIVAGYSATRPNVANVVGWQYTNGVENHTANPSSTPPFGHCDHNELYVDELSPSGGGIPTDGPPVPLPITPGDTDMSFRMVQDPRSPAQWAMGDTWAIGMANGAEYAVWASDPDCVNPAAIYAPDPAHWDQKWRRMVLVQPADGRTLGDALRDLITPLLTQSPLDLTPVVNAAQVGAQAGATAALNGATVVSTLSIEGAPA